jgi:adenine phosphoribosyltransferase
MFEEVLKFYKDFPIEGINFVDIVPLMQDREVFGALIGEIGRLVTAPSVAAPEARSFFFTAPLLVTGSGVSNIIPFRKKGKLPHAGDDLQDISIMKEYGADHIFFRNAVAVAYDVVSEPVSGGTSVVSDHFPVYADFEVSE